MEYFRRNIYDENLVELPKKKDIDFFNLRGQSNLEFIQKYIKEDEVRRFVSLKHLEEKELECLKKLYHFTLGNTANHEIIFFDELERMLIECLFDGRKEEGMGIYYLMKKYPKVIALSDLKKIDKRLATYIVENRNEYKQIIKEDKKIILCVDGVDEEVLLEENEDDYVSIYLDDLYRSTENMIKKGKNLKFKNIEDNKNI